MPALVNILLLICAAFCDAMQSSSFDKYNRRRCERITVSMCLDMQYNYTGMPNWWKHYDQDQAEHAIKEFETLINVGCSDKLKFFLCSTFTPMCSEDVDYGIVACRSVCEDVRDKCRPILEEYGYEWPKPLECEKFPRRGKGHSEKLCMYPPEFAANDRSVAKTPAATRKRTEVPRVHNQGMQELDPAASYNEDFFAPSASESDSAECQKLFIPLEGSFTSRGQKIICAQNCAKDVKFSAQEKGFAFYWTMSLVCICFILNLTAVFTFFLDPSRFAYPYRPIFFMSASYAVHCTAYFIRWGLGPHRTSCSNRRPSFACSYLIQTDLQSSNDYCVVVFLISYYSWISSALWWVVLTFTVYLQLGWKYATESISNKATLFHISGWLPPAILSIAILLLKKVDGDELTGLCGVGYSDHKSMLFVIIPFSACLLLGVIFCVLMIPSFICTARAGSQSCHSVKSGTKFGVQINDADLMKFEKRVFKIGLFSILYIFAAAALLGCYAYEMNSIQAWQPFLDECKGPPMSLFSDMYNVYICKIFQLLLNFSIGIGTGLWVLWSPKTWETWKNGFFLKIFFCLKLYESREKAMASGAAQSLSIECSEMYHNATRSANSSMRRSPNSGNDYRVCPRDPALQNPQQRPLLGHHIYENHRAVRGNGVIAAMSQTSQESTNRYAPIFA